MSFAYVSLLLNDDYLPGAVVLAHSIRDSGTQHELVILVTRAVSRHAQDKLSTLYDRIITVDAIDSHATENLSLMGRPDLVQSITKIQLWKLVQYKQVIYLDADAIVLQNIDHLFDLGVDFAAAPDIGWPDIFNSGMFLATPNMGVLAALTRLATAGVSFDGGDQGLLNTYFSKFHRLSFTYNCTSSSGYQYQPAFKHFESQLKVAHFIGEAKPWKVGAGGVDGAYGRLLARWWAIHDAHQEESYGPSKSAGLEQREVLQPEPQKGRPQAAQLSFINFKNTWDEPLNSAMLSPSGTRTPKSVHFERSSGPIVNPIFPWEGKSTSERVFAEDAVAPIQEVRTIPRPFESPDIDESAPEIIQFSNAWDKDAEIQRFVKDSGISTSKRELASVWGSGTHTPKEPEIEVAASPTQPTQFDLVPSGVADPTTWNPNDAVDKLAQDAQSLAHAAAGLS